MPQQVKDNRGSRLVRNAQGILVPETPGEQTLTKRGQADQATKDRRATAPSVQNPARMSDEEFNAFAQSLGAESINLTAGPDKNKPGEGFGSKDMGRRIVKGLNLVSGLAPGTGWPMNIARALATGVTGGAANAMEDESPTSGFLWNAVPELVLPGAGNAMARQGVRTALKQGVPTMTEGERQRNIGAFIRESERGPIRGVGTGHKIDAGLPISVGDQTAPRRRIETLQGQFDPAYAQSNRRFDITDATGGGQKMIDERFGEPNPDEILAMITGADKDMVVSHVTARLKQHPVGTAILNMLGGDLNNVPPQTLHTLATGQPMSAREFADLMTTQKARGANIIKKLKDPASPIMPAGQDLVQGQLPAARAEMMQGKLLSALPSEYEQLIKRYADLKTIENTNRKISDTWSKKSIRGGLFGTLFGLGERVAGGTGLTGAAAGGLTGVMLSPQNVSRLGFTGRRGAQVAPTIGRGSDLAQDMGVDPSAIVEYLFSLPGATAESVSSILSAIDQKILQRKPQ